MYSDIATVYIDKWVSTITRRSSEHEASHRPQCAHRTQLTQALCCSRRQSSRGWINVTLWSRHCSLLSGWDETCSSVSLRTGSRLQIQIIPPEQGVADILWPPVAKREPSGWISMVKIGLPSWNTQLGFTSFMMKFYQAYIKLIELTINYED